MCPTGLSLCSYVSQQLLRHGNDNKIFIFKPHYLRCCWVPGVSMRKAEKALERWTPPYQVSVLRQGASPVGVQF